VLLDHGPDVNPRAVVADKGYDAKTNREAARKRGICPVIPYRSNTIDKPKFFVLYKARARIEQMMGKIKRFKRIALRCEKTATNYASFLALVCFILIKSVHTVICGPNRNFMICTANRHAIEDELEPSECISKSGC
jgi:transposase